MNDCSIGHPFVSDFHAQMELSENGLSVRDLNSRNGIFDRAGARLPAGRPIPLGTLGNSFVVGRAVRVDVETFEEDRDVGSRSSIVQGAVLGNRAAMAEGGGAMHAPAGRRAESVVGAPPQVGWASGLAPLPPLSRVEPAGFDRSPGRPAHVGASASAGASAGQSLAPLPPLASLPFVPGLDPAPYSPAAPRASDVQPVRGDVNRDTQHFAMSVETLALQGIRELASSLVPGPPLETTGEVARLLTKLHDLVAVFCRCFVPLRDARIGDVRAHRRLSGSASAFGVERAADPAALAAVLLDWRNYDYDAPDAVESILLDVITQQTAMIESVVRGVEVLMQELSPEKLEKAVKDEAGAAMFGRHRALWSAFKKRYEELVGGEREIELVFGKEVATWYRDRVTRYRETKP